MNSPMATTNSERAAAPTLSAADRTPAPRRGWWRRIFATPSAAQLALAELEEAQRQLLLSQSGKEFAESMVKYHTQRIARLRAFLREANSEDAAQ